MDCRELNINNNSIDLAIDKSTIDALLCGENSFINVAKMLKEVQRVLKIGGYYLMISYGCPENRLIHIERKFLGFDIKILKIAKNEKVEIFNENKNNKDNNNIDDNNNFESSHYVYICKKKTNADYLSNKYYKTILNELENQSDFEKDITGMFSNKEKLQELINLICKKEKEKKIVENGSENNSEIEISETISNKNNNSEYTYHYKYNNDSSNLSSSKTNDKNKKNSKYYSNSESSY